MGDALRMIQPSNSSAILTQENIEAARTFLASEAYNAIAVNYAPASAFHTFRLNLLFFSPTITLPTSFSALMHYANGLFILPVLAGASQFLMTKIMNGKQTKEQKELQAQQAADQTNPMNSPVMKWFFPLFSVWICATSNAAFSIYWMAANVIQIAQQLAVNYWFERQDAKAAETAQVTDD